MHELVYTETLKELTRVKNYVIFLIARSSVCLQI